jgi:hypothetical protein
MMAPHGDRDATVIYNHGLLLATCWFLTRESAYAGLLTAFRGGKNEVLIDPCTALKCTVSYKDAVPLGVTC